MKGDLAALSAFLCMLSGTQIPAQTNRDGILAAMQKYLVDMPRPGDTVVFYDASHRSLRVNSQGNKLTVLVNGKYVYADSTLVPTDAYKGGYDVREREMTRIFNSALDKSIHLTIILTVAGGRLPPAPERMFFSGWNRA